MADTKSVPGVGPILKLGEEKLSQLLTQLLSNESFVSALQTSISTALKAKGTMDKSLVSLLSAFNVPTLEDVATLRGKIQELEDAIADLTKVIDAVDKKASGAGHAAEGAHAGKKKKAKREE